MEIKVSAMSSYVIEKKFQAFFTYNIEKETTSMVSVLCTYLHIALHSLIICTIYCLSMSSDIDFLSQMSESNSWILQL